MHAHIHVHTHTQADGLDEYVMEILRLFSFVAWTFFWWSTEQLIKCVLNTLLSVHWFKVQLIVNFWRRKQYAEFHFKLAYCVLSVRTVIFSMTMHAMESDFNDDQTKTYSEIKLYLRCCTQTVIIRQRFNTARHCSRYKTRFIAKIYSNYWHLVFVSVRCVSTLRSVLFCARNRCYLNTVYVFFVSIYLVCFPVTNDNKHITH